MSLFLLFKCVFSHRSVYFGMNCLPSCCAAWSELNLTFIWTWSDKLTNGPLLSLCTYLLNSSGVAVADGHMLHILFTNMLLFWVWATLLLHRMWTDRNCKHTCKHNEHSGWIHGSQWNKAELLTSKVEIQDVDETEECDGHQSLHVFCGSFFSAETSWIFRTDLCWRAEMCSLYIHDKTSCYVLRKLDLGFLFPFLL